MSSGLVRICWCLDSSKRLKSIKIKTNYKVNNLAAQIYIITFVSYFLKLLLVAFVSTKWKRAVLSYKDGKSY